LLNLGRIDPILGLLFLRSLDMTRATLEGRGVAPREHEEGTITKAIEHYTSMVPSGAYLSLAIGSIGLAAMMKMAGRDKDAEFIGQWVPTILILGLYNKLVKLQGSD
jgi:hypothetical protein